MPVEKKDIQSAAAGVLCVFLIFALLIAGTTSLHAQAPPSDLPPPHDPLTLPGGCLDCHSLPSPPPELTVSASNANLCLSCHSLYPRLAQWHTARQAVPGDRGTSHRWDADAVSPDYAAELPESVDMLERIDDDGRLMCSTCHNQHEANNYGGRVYVSPVEKTVGAGGSGTLAVGPPEEDAAARHYSIEIIEPTPAATFRVSNDKGTSWFGWTGSSWSPGEPQGRPVGTDVSLTDGDRVTVSFSGTFAAGDQLYFFVTRPMLRVDNSASAMCVECHRTWNQSAAEQVGGGDGIKVFSHPVGDPLKPGRDRVGAVLDANGALQTGPHETDADGNDTNNLLLDASGNVHCLTCHSVHGADSNSLTEDPR